MLIVTIRKGIALLFFRDRSLPNCQVSANNLWPQASSIRCNDSLVRDLELVKGREVICGRVENFPLLLLTVLFS